MALIEQTLFGTVDKVQIAIDRLRAFQPKDKPYWLAYSGGKDSCAILELAKMAGVNFEAHYSVTSVDPPELVRFVKTNKGVSFDIPHDREGKPISMWSLLKSRAMPPTRIARYCCEKLKESSGKGTVTITGVRWAESVNRKNSQGLVNVFGKTKREAIILNDDNDESRRQVEVCFRTRKTLVNPIIDWADEDVWEFIHKYNVPYCELYDMGWSRLGCIGCPMSGNRQKELDAYPKYKEQYLRCFDVMYKNRIERGYETVWKCGRDIYDWWIGQDKMSEKQLTLLEEL